MGSLAQLKKAVLLHGRPTSAAGARAQEAARAAPASEVIKRATAAYGGAPAAPTIIREEEPLQKKRFLTGQTAGRRPYLR